MNKPDESSTQTVRAETLIFVGPFNDEIIPTIQSLDRRGFGIKHLAFVEEVGHVTLLEYHGVIVYCRSSDNFQEVVDFCEVNNLPLITSKDQGYDKIDSSPVIRLSNEELSRLGQVSNLMNAAKKLGVELTVANVTTDVSPAVANDYRNIAYGLLKLVQIIKQVRRGGGLLQGSRDITYFLHRL